MTLKATILTLKDSIKSGSVLLCQSTHSNHQILWLIWQETSEFVERQKKMPWARFKPAIY